MPVLVFLLTKVFLGHLQISSVASSEGLELSTFQCRQGELGVIPWRTF